MKTILSVLENRSENTVILICLNLILVFLIAGALFKLTAAVLPLFIIPILLVSWYGGSKAGVLLSVFTVFLIGSVGGYFNSFDFSGYTFIYLNISLFITCVFVATIVTDFQKVHQQEITAANTDMLTGVLNSRSFNLELANEILRSIRYKHVFSLAYIDIDNFKTVNDTLGHSSGDALLIEVANTLKASLRKTDSVARIGGDEFACLFPETDFDEVKEAYSKAKNLLSEKMEKNKWPVTFSVGIVTFDSMPDDLKQAIKIADDLMYSIKNKDKNNVAYRLWTGA